ncbi:Peptidyl-prolyl cis-trans isomerase cyp8 [Glutinoglossum americanum]|uniref:Peptidyl-prolyl cis-trans isomerase-like 2 n=1 Tax=Glutinoglossum americanum TaxID=1670608 RepID=A0A9P8IB56_9PEZI|nr:Peptidyl-prolyl cis-trans isomerase cyp8 [Glutinoglossum americanum]
MGKEWSSSDAYSASSGSGTARPKAAGAGFKRLPFNFCAVSLQPFEHPVCTADGTIFDLTNILPWLKKHGTNPVTGTNLDSKELIKLHFHKNDDGEYVDPVTYKVFTDNTHIVALRNTGNVFAWDTVERLNIKAKMWQDLVSDEAFGRADIITLQDPQNVGSRDLGSFKYLQDGVSALTPEQEAERADPLSGINLRATGSAAKVLAAKQAVVKARAARTSDSNHNPTLPSKGSQVTPKTSTTPAHRPKANVPYNAAGHTTGKAAASFTSTGLTPHTSLERALLTDEEYMLKPRRVKIKGYARIQTSLGDVNVELHTEYAPKAVYNFVQLAKKGYYRDTTFHRNIRNFMIQGGDPTGTGKGGTSYWGKNFNDEFDGPLTHDARGILSMANKGKNTNSSQFFITYRPAKHLDRKHTIFGHVVDGTDTLSRLEAAKTNPNDGDRPIEAIRIIDVVIFIDPFEEFLKKRKEVEEGEREREILRGEGGAEDERVSWTGKRVRDAGGGVAERRGESAGVGKYLKAGGSGKGDGGGEVVVEEWEGLGEEPVKKKARGNGGFGNFDAW